MHIFNVGASDTEGDALMFRGGGVCSPTTHFRYHDEPEFDADNSVRVVKATIDGLSRVGSIRNPEFIKVDVEGHAGHALAGARQTIARSRPVMLVSTHGANESEAVSVFSRECDYKTVWSLSRKPWRAHEARAEEAVLLLP